MPATSLNALLDANACFALAAKGTTNHCPMALIALAKMGAQPSRLQAFFNHWERDYAILASPTEQLVARAEWRAQLGRSEAFAALTLCFQAWLAEEGAGQVVRAVFEQIPSAPGTGAFHAWIRLAYGLEAEHAGEIAAGLAALVVGNLEIVVALDARPAAHSIDDALAHLAEVFSGGVFVSNSIVARLRAVAADPRFAASLPAPPVWSSVPEALDALARSAIAAYWQSADFTVLHMVTVTHAARRLLALLPAEYARQLLADLWVAWCAAYISIGAPRLDPTAYPLPSLETLPDWPPLLAAAVESNDDHVIKMVYTCYCEAARDPQPVYRAVAARLVQREAARQARRG